MELARDEKHRFITGNIGGPGRPKGARNKLGEAFLEALHDDFAEHGIQAIETVRTEKPDQYLKVIASLLPRDVNLTVNDERELTDDELIERIRYLTATVAPFLSGGAGEPEPGTGSEARPRKPAIVH